MSLLPRSLQGLCANARISGSCSLAAHTGVPTGIVMSTFVAFPSSRHQTRNNHDVCGFAALMDRLGHKLKLRHPQPRVEGPTISTPRFGSNCTNPPRPALPRTVRLGSNAGSIEVTTPSVRERANSKTQTTTLVFRPYSRATTAPGHTVSSLGNVA
jgi:hypothetical protein